MTFLEELRDLLNRHSKENGLNTPDFILAQYLEACLITFETAVRARDGWCNVPITDDMVQALRVPGRVERYEETP